MLTKEKLQHIFKGDIIGKEILFYESTSSTNETAFEIGREREDPEGIVVIADTQTCGKGRMGRNWISPPGVNLYFTVLLRPHLPLEEIQFITFATAVAVTTVIREETGLQAGIKWPNDILINGKKAGGILVEMKSSRERMGILAVGIGINVNMSLNSLPEEIRTDTTSLNIEKREDIDRVTLLGKILTELEKGYKNLLKGNKGALITEWLRLNSTIGNSVKVRMQDRTISGTAEGIGDRGELIVRLSSGKTESVIAGDVTIIKG